MRRLRRYLKRIVYSSCDTALTTLFCVLVTAFVISAYTQYYDYKAKRDFINKMQLKAEFYDLDDDIKERIQALKEKELKEKKETK